MTARKVARPELRIPPGTSPDGAVLLKLRPSLALRAAGSRTNIRPLHDNPQGMNAMMGIGAEPQWFVAELADGGPTPWDLAHSRVADQLGIDESDVIIAEPDLVHNVFVDTNENPSEGFAVGSDCRPVPQDTGNGKPIGPDEFAWHLGDEYSQLGSARDAVVFTVPRTRIAHLDTGYYPKHATVPQHVLTHLERNFVSGDRNSGSASDPDNRKFLIDNSGHGTGTIGILAGREAPDSSGVRLGGAPDADILPLRIADRVVLLRTSAFAQALQYALDQRCDVVTMSMGGLPSRAWSEHVNRAYLGGICIVSAAGNNVRGAPTRNLVYPARYGRVIAACGVMANGSPYAGLQGTTLQGNFGPTKHMASAISAYTPNIAWPQFGCPDHTRRNGEGTSSATPQVAAAVALWYERYKAELPRDWRRVEAVREALFRSAKSQDDPDRLGNGILQAAAALAVRPVLTLEQTKADNDSFAFLRVLTGLGVAEPPPREQMFNLELAQLWMVSDALQELVPDPDDTATLGADELRSVMEAVIEDRRASRSLRRHLANRYPAVVGRRARRVPEAEDVIAPDLAVCPAQPEVREPPHRRLRVYASDPSFSTRLDTADTNEVTLKVRWENFEPRRDPKAPLAGEYLVVDTADATGASYDSIVPDDPRLLAQDGWAPSEGNPQFHQQMVYAVAMKTIEHFERALGRPVMWRSKPNPGHPADDPAYVGQLLMRPHALRQANAYYSPAERAIKFGYFEAATGDPGVQVPETRVYTCLSHDIVAHETTHAILDGMQQRFNEPTNPDVLALHEAFADIVALFQHFTIGEILEREIARTRGNLEEESILGRLAVQFGQATGGRGALRDAIGTMKDGRWHRLEPDPNALQNLQTPHARGALLVAAVFDAFIAISRTRTTDLLRIYTGGTGELKGGAIHPDLVRRLADEASKAASHVLNMCIRAIDYLPPVDVTFFEYLRALITADSDLVRDDKLNYRVAFVEAFRRRGIYPVNLAAATDDTLRTISVDTLRWSGFNLGNLSKTAAGELQSTVLEGLKKYADQCFYLSKREDLFEVTRTQRKALQKQLRSIFRTEPSFAKELGVDDPATFEVHDLRRAMRMSPDGQHTPQLIVSLTQEATVPANAADGTPEFTFRGGSTLVIDLAKREIKYRIVKNIGSRDRRARAGAFAKGVASDPLRALFLGADRTEPFAVLHSLAEDAR